jgi:tetratricopeptide (TPR) repeat protein
LRRISKSSVLKRIIFLLFVLLLSGCALEKQSAVNRGLQNLTAHYNILFNANELLRQKQESYALSFVDSYNEILSVYQDTTSKTATADKDLEEAKVKANKIINIKEQSHYLGDAYLVLGKANYLEGDYFDAVEFFSYVIRSFPKNFKLTQEALVWKARSMIYLNQLPQAKLVLDTAIQNINPKKPGKSVTTEVYAAKLQYDIDVQDYPDAEETAKLAIHYCHDTPLRLRWTFILAQIQELNNKTADAFKNYTRIIKSNVPFEMAFNANLNRIRIEENKTGSKVTRIDRLRSLLKNENNKDFTDQIYYQIAELYLAAKDIDNAMKNYRLSVRYSKKNPNQKGLSYLRLADIYFKNKADYVDAKKYYDSTLFNLSSNYPGYQIIQKKSNNLQLLADRFGIISREDTLQMLAQLDQKTRAAKIDAMVNRQILQQQTAVPDNAGSEALNNNSPKGGNFGSSFYFYNSNAVNLGYSDFKRRWGNRKLEDNWRRSNRASSDITNNTSQTIDPDAPADQLDKSKNTPTAGNYRKQLIKDLPLTPELLAQSNSRIYNAYFDIANFYRDILGDKKEAIAIYELLLNRFPNSTDKPAIYYNLYRLYSEEDNPAKSDEYKNLLLKNFADTPFAKIINDPEYGKRLNDADAGLNALYNQVYDDYSKKDYKKAISRIDDLLKQYPNNKWSAQLAYLRAISLGHQEKLAPFRDDLAQIISNYPDDRLIVPLVKQHLAYIDVHQDEMSAGEFALTNNDPNEVPFKVTPTAEDQITAYNNSQLVQQTAQQRINPATKQPEINPTKTKQAGNNPNVNNPAAANQAPSIFSTRDSTNYYFVVNVSSGTSNLASSRFGIGQFNRANFQAGTITHQLMSVGADNQLIYAGRFYSLDAVKAYARAIIPILPEIMKVPKDKYSFFIITQENLDKLTDKTRLDSYMDFYQNNY